MIHTRNRPPKHPHYNFRCASCDKDGISLACVKQHQLESATKQRRKSYFGDGEREHALCRGVEAWDSCQGMWKPITIFGSLDVSNYETNRRSWGPIAGDDPQLNDDEAEEEGIRDKATAYVTQMSKDQPPTDKNGTKPLIFKEKSNLKKKLCHIQ